MGQVLSYMWRCVRQKLIKDIRTIPHNDQVNQSDQDNHYIDSDATQAISSSNPIVNSSSQIHAYTTEEHFIVVDLSNVDHNNDSAKMEEEYEKVAALVVNKEVITEVSVMPFKLTGVPRETIQKIGPYTSMQRILLVGEGDFSFSTSLALAFGCASNMIATSLNSQEFLTKNYNKFLNNKMELEIRGCMVIHNVDATYMVKHPILGSLRFDRIIFNFPHAGSFGRTNADMRLNRKLISGFLSCAKKMVNGDGEIHITHKSSWFFRQWDIPKIGSDQGLHLIQECTFIRSMYPGYHTKYGFGGNKDFHCNPSKTYEFGMHPT